MMKYKLLLLLVCSSLVFSRTIFAQTPGERLVDIDFLTIPKGLSKQVPLKNTINLPFFDDFSRGKAAPAHELWEGKNVFINNRYAINPPSVGVATFDAVDHTGALHYQASTFPFSSDTLTSKVINLGFPADTTIYISFAFQPKGLGNQPDSKDSLLLEFFDGALEEWVSAWGASVDFSKKQLSQSYKLNSRLKEIKSDTLERTFFRVHFPILDERFKTPSFRFRFRNIASVSTNTDVPGLRSNSDHWHIDMVHLNKGRNYVDTLLNDITYSKPLSSFLRNYESIPWGHFNAAIDQELTDPLTFKIQYRNLGAETWNITRRFCISNLSNGSAYNFTGGSENIFKQQDIEYTRLFQYTFSSAWVDSAKFQFSTHLITDLNNETSHLRWNDTLSYTQTFRNFYAYDDGTAESGYGLYGEGTQGGRVAVKFSNYKDDKLVGVYMYFNRTFSDANSKYFKLAVWNDNNGKPGDIIYEQEGAKTYFKDSLNQFVLYKLNQEVSIPQGEFYVGWIQITTDMLNVGFDMNRQSKNKIFYNISGSWQSTQFDGSLMIRPAFGQLIDVPATTPVTVSTPAVTLYPNPAHAYFSLRGLESADGSFVAIHNLLGQTVKTSPYTGERVDVADLPRGSYVVTVAIKGRVVAKHKLVLLR